MNGLISDRQQMKLRGLVHGIESGLSELKYIKPEADGTLGAAETELRGLLCTGIRTRIRMLAEVLSA